MNQSISSIKQKAVNLRRKGMSYSQINKIIGVPKSTLSSWFSKDQELSIIKEANLTNAKKVWAKNITDFNKKRAEQYREKISLEIQKTSEEIGFISKESLKYLGIGLFMAEGSKKEKWSLRFVNSSPTIILIIMKFFREICGCDEDKFRFRVHIHNPAKYQNALIYWSKTVNIPMSQFYSPQFLISRSSKAKRTHSLPYGILHIYYLNAPMNRKLKGWIKGVESKLTV